MPRSTPSARLVNSIHFIQNRIAPTEQFSPDQISVHLQHTSRIEWNTLVDNINLAASTDNAQYWRQLKQCTTCLKAQAQPGFTYNLPDTSNTPYTAFLLKALNMRQSAQQQFISVFNTVHQQYTHTTQNRPVSHQHTIIERQKSISAAILLTQEQVRSPAALEKSPQSFFAKCARIAVSALAAIEICAKQFFPLKFPNDTIKEKPTKLSQTPTSPIVETEHTAPDKMSAAPTCIMLYHLDNTKNTPNSIEKVIFNTAYDRNTGENDIDLIQGIVAQLCALEK